MSTMKLTYFNSTSGRGEPLRIVLDAGGIPFEDHRISFAEFAETAKTFPLGAVPVADIDGTVYTQSNALIRYYGKQTGLYPEDAWEAYKCDEVMGATEDLINKLVQTFGLKDEALVTARKRLVDGPITQYVRLLDSRLEAAGGHYLADNRLTVADLKVFIQLKALTSGFLEHVPTDTVESISPRISDYAKRMAAESIVKSYAEKTS